MPRRDPTPLPLATDTIAEALRVAPSAGAAAKLLKVDIQRLRFHCRQNDELRPIFNALADRGKQAAKRGIGRMAFSSVPAGLYLGPR